jgi:hypothetical protein
MPGSCTPKIGPNGTLSPAAFTLKLVLSRYELLDLNGTFR